MTSHGGLGPPPRMSLPHPLRLFAALPPGRPGDPGLYGPGSVAWRVHGEAVLMLGGPRALLMQLANPAVAAAVARHSDFPRDAYRRLARTTRAMLALSFGDLAQAQEAADAITAVHRGVRGRTASGRRYRALDPELLLWVHATLVDTALEVHRRLLRPLGWDLEERYYLETTMQAELLGIPARVVPADLSRFRAYVSRSVADLDVSDEARRLAPAILTPPLPLPFRPLGWSLSLVTEALLPPGLRTGYGIAWSLRHAAAADAFELGMRRVAPRIPSLFRRWPDAGLAQRRAGAAPRIEVPAQPGPTSRLSATRRKSRA